MTTIAQSRRILIGIILVTLIIGYAGWQLAYVSAQEIEPVAYLPLVIRAPGPAGKIPNGDFEAGRVFWTESSKIPHILIVPGTDLPRSVSPHNGQWAAWLGGDINEQASIEQSLDLDLESLYLVYWLWIDAPIFSCQGTTGAEMTVSLDQSTIYQSQVCTDTDTGGWVEQVIDVRAFAGQTAKLRFELTTGASSSANIYLDDIDFRSTP